jgi:L-iditol 2-dehydrogenase
VPFNDLWFKNVTITTSYAAGPEDVRRSVDLISSRQVRVQEMITHELGLEDTAKGFELVWKAEDSLKVIIEPHR